MSTERFRRLQSLFEDAQQQPAEEREAWLRAVCSDDAALVDEVSALLVYELQLANKRTRDPWSMTLAQLQSDDDASWAGRSIDRYELVQEIGSGGMGRVFKARRRDADVEQWVALKLMRRERIQESLIQRFSHERRILAHLQHSGIAHFIDAGTDADGTPYVVMELVEGLPIVEHCDRHHLDLRARLSLFRQVLAAVSHAHRALIIHRDIKPGNVLVTVDGFAKLLDFGIAKPLSFAADDTLTIDRVFTPASAAPEQLRGGIVDVTTDVYGLGALLYELLSGCAAIEAHGLSASELERRVCLQPPVPMNVARLDRIARQGDASSAPGVPIPQDVESIVQKALRKEPDARYQSAEQFDADIERFMQQRPVLASGVGRAYRLRKFLQRNAWPVIFSGFASAAITAAAVLVVLQNRAVRVERDRAQSALAIMKDAFVAADPSRLAGGDVTARQILESSRRSIAPLAATQPENYVDLATNIADVQLSLGLVEPAAGLLIEASAVAASLPPGGRTHQGLQILAAKAQLEQNEVTAAERIVDASLKPDGAQAATYWYLKGVIRLKRSQFAEAIDAFHRFRAARTPSAEDGEWVHAQLLLADALASEKRVEEALNVLDELIAMLQIELGTDHSQMVRAQLARLDVLQVSGQSDRMRRDGQALVEQITRSYGRASALTGSAEAAVASAFIASAHYAEAAEHMRLAAQSFDQSLGSMHPKSYRTRFDLGSLLWRVPGRSGEAEAEFDTALANAMRHLPVAHPTLGFFRLEFANYLVWMRKPERALYVFAADSERLKDSVLAEAERVEIARMLAAAYTQADCGNIPDDLVEAESTAAICAATPVDAAHCLSAREIACQLYPAKLAPTSPVPGG
jgi:eukaryotic-like serine/threonine-protein kinase